MALVAKRLEVDFAPAMVGFEFQNGRSLPVFEGIVVCADFKDAILEVISILVCWFTKGTRKMSSTCLYNVIFDGKQ